MDIGTEIGDRSDFVTAAFKDARHNQAELRHYNRERINKRANAKELKIGDRVMVFVEVPGTHTNRWDPGYRITRMRNDTIWVTDISRGGVRVLNRSKVKLVDPDLDWDNLSPRPTRYEIRKATRGQNPPTVEELEYETARPRQQQVNPPEPAIEERNQEPLKLNNQKEIRRKRGRPPKVRVVQEDAPIPTQPNQNKGDLIKDRPPTPYPQEENAEIILKQPDREERMKRRELIRNKLDEIKDKTLGNSDPAVTVSKNTSPENQTAPKMPRMLARLQDTPSLVKDTLHVQSPDKRITRSQTSKKN